MDYNNEEDYDAYLPKRSDAIYQEIESFEEYELTQCVAYEMAVRNKNNLKAIEEVVEFYNQYKEYLAIPEYFNQIEQKINNIDCLKNCLTIR